jgi:hypothetical protein
MPSIPELTRAYLAAHAADADGEAGEDRRVQGA